jgi:hypothetical protein
MSLRFAYLTMLHVFGWLALTARSDRAILAALARRHWAYPGRVPGRPRTVRPVRALVLEMARASPGRASPGRASPGRGCRRIHGELAGLGCKLAPSTAWQILKDAGLRRDRLGGLIHEYSQVA